MQVRTALAIGSWAILAIALAQQQAHLKMRKAGAPPTREQRIAALHAGVQSALEDLSMTKLHTVTARDASGKTFTYKVGPSFGLERTSQIAILHNGVMRETGVAAQFLGTDSEIEYFGVSNKGKPLASRGMQLQAEFGWAPAISDPTLSKQVVEFAKQSLEPLKQESVYRGTVHGMAAQARPIFLTKAECMPCHHGSKLGDPAAILVYLVRPSSRQK